MATVPKIVLDGTLPAANGRRSGGGGKMQERAPRAVDPGRKEKLRAALIRKLLSKYHPGISNSKTERLVESEVDRLMGMDKVTEDVLHEVETRVRRQSNDEIAFIVTNPFKNVTSHKSGAKDEWAAMNDMVVKVSAYSFPSQASEVKES